MNKMSILAAASGALLAASLTLAGPALAHEGGTGRAHGVSEPAPAYSAARSADADGPRGFAPGGRIGVGIFTDHSPAVGMELPFAPVGP